jgi:O-antigen ligase
VSADAIAAGPAMTAAAIPAIFVTGAAIRNFVFFIAVLAMKYTLSRPSPVDILFLAAAAFSLFAGQRLRSPFFVLFSILVLWVAGFMFASLPFLDDSNVRAEALKKTFVVTLGLIGCYVSSSWRARTWVRFFKVYVLSTAIAAGLGTFGFFAKVDALTWDERARGFIDDPNMYASFLLPGVLFCIYLLNTRQGRKAFLVPALLILLVGVLLSFSRAASVSLILSAGGYIVFLNRHHFSRLMAQVAVGCVFLAMLFVAAFAISPTFAEKFTQRATFAASYDQGHGGRYGRYAQSVPMIIENPRGLGILQQELVFEEPIHNIFLSSFLNYGWLGGFSWVALFVLSLVVGFHSYRRSSNPVAVVLLFSFLAPVLCAGLHEGEHWRHLWLMTGLLWGFAGTTSRDNILA